MIFDVELFFCVKLALYSISISSFEYETNFTQAQYVKVNF